ncbi:MAG TPA: hypothetical protein VGK67_29710 [Myxococcales bacterium]|jgi:hypothetical protein
MKMKTHLVAFVASALLFGVGCSQPANTDPKPCEPKTCEGEGWQCGTLDDGCGNRLECGTCSAPLICGGGDDPHACAPCRAESTAAFCTRHERDCGPFTGDNLCGASRTVNCGSCSNGMTCGGGGFEGRCGTPACQPESDKELCTAFQRACGPLTTNDRCQQPRTVDCGECPDATVLSPGPDAAQPTGIDAAQPAGLDATSIEPPDASAIEPPDANLVVIDPPDASVPLDYDAGSQACAAESTKAQQLPLDIYIMLDYSGSMSGTPWTQTTAAIEAFLAQPLTGVSVGLQYFGVPPAGPTQTCSVYSCTNDSDCGTGCGPCLADYYYGKSCSGYSYSIDDSCLAADYAKPAVEIAPLPGVATDIHTSIVAHNSPNTLTPTAPALTGAIQHARDWAVAHPGHVAIDIFATDGVPTECSPTDEAGVNAIAAAGLAGTPKVLTFVIGVGTSLTKLNGMAAAGGTGQAYLVDTGGNVTQQMLTALNAIRGAALGCAYSIPPPTAGATLDLNKVNVQYTPGTGGSPQLFVQVLDEAHCPSGSDGWHYDDSTNPTKIVLCSATCQRVQADTSGQVDILIGCATQHCPPTVQCGFGF